MKKSKIIIIAAMFGLLTGVVFSLSAKTAHADDCSLTTNDFAQLTAVQNNTSLSYSDELQQELAIRKQLVGKTITCTEAEVAVLKATVASTTVDSDSATLQSQLFDKLNDASNFFTIQSTKLNTAGIAGTEAIARDTLAYRTGSYTTLVSQINNFILWSQNQNLFATAQARMDQTQRAVSFLESASSNSDLQTAFDQAYSSFQTAQTQNVAAKTALMQSLPPDQSLALIKQSLDSLSATYQDFFTVSADIKQLLPQ
jgi:predicted permease